MGFLHFVGDFDKARSAKEEARESKLQEESLIRLKVDAIKKRLSLVLTVLGAVAAANPALAHEQLPALVIVSTLMQVLLVHL